jgi:hypothetical protein
MGVNVQMLLVCGAMLLGVALGAQEIQIYTDNEMQDWLRASLASAIALLMYIARILQEPWPGIRKAIGGTIQTIVIAVVMILLVREISGNNLAAELLAGAVVGMEGPKAGSRLKQILDNLSKAKGGSDGNS